MGKNKGKYFHCERMQEIPKRVNLKDVVKAAKATYIPHASPCPDILPFKQMTTEFH